MIKSLLLSTMVKLLMLNEFKDLQKIHIIP
uniref:Uncharacterized protein n=1 Tax=Siphoviridae sp. ctBCr48 TaxID=2827802 RepID=A0A8S5SHQ3_9CAUD|nr:MAG TPA: hypothetical protein [Siphoviridae sp. ctBCr48]